MSSESKQVEVSAATAKALDVLDGQLVDVDTETMARQYLQTRDILAARQRLIESIDRFWPVVFANAAAELEGAITAEDAHLLDAAFVGLDVSRPEIPADAKPTDSGLAAFGEPNSICITFRFRENEYFSNPELKKTFWLRRAKAEGPNARPELVSEPVLIDWKSAEKDLTRGLNAAAYKLWEVQQAVGADKAIINDRTAQKARDAEARKLPEFARLAKMLETNTESTMSFFNFFAYRGRWVSAAESAEATAAWRARRDHCRELLRAGNHEELGRIAEAEEAEEAAANAAAEAEDDDESGYAEADVECFPAGHDTAVTIAEDIWPSAIDYFLYKNDDDDEDDDDDDSLDLDDADKTSDADVKRS